MFIIRLTFIYTIKLNKSIYYIKYKNYIINKEIYPPSIKAELVLKVESNNLLTNNKLNNMNINKN